MSQVGDNCDLGTRENNKATEAVGEKLDMEKLKKEGVQKFKEHYLKFDEEIGRGSFKKVFNGCYSTGRLTRRFHRPSTATAWPGYQTGD